MLIILTGPAATGKTTISNMLALKFPKSVHLPVDIIRHFIKSGFAKASADNEESENQIELAEEITYDMIVKYNQKGFVVILDDVIGSDRLLNYKHRFRDVYCFLLLPSLEDLHKRDQARAIEARMGTRVDYLHSWFSKMDKSSYIAIDTTNQTPVETTEIIYGKIAERISSK